MAKAKGKAKLAPVHPGEILREDLMKPLGLSSNALALALRVPVTRVNDIVRGKRAITADTAMRLARYFDSTAEFWLGLQAQYDLRIAAENESRIRSEVQPRRTIAA